ncbi:MAG: hypothetical protein GQ524_07610 [Anaerolineales bacterium]|nr:hypothetical protein [Anaerolineales bacterium]
MELSNGERAVISILVQQMEGVDKNDARMVVAVGDTLNLNDQQSFKLDEQDITEEYDIGKVEKGWIKDKLNDAFQARKVPPFVAKHALTLSDKLENEDA